MRLLMECIDKPYVWWGVLVLLSVWMAVLGVTQLVFEYYTLVFDAVLTEMQKCGNLTRC